VRFEKELEDQDSSFWTGSYIVDGTLSYSGENLKALLSIRGKDSIGEKSIVKGKISNLPEFNRLIVNKILSAVKAEKTLEEWDSAKEAKEYFDEGIWALNNGLYAFAEAALDSAWALGYKNGDCATARINAYCNNVYMKDNFPKDEARANRHQLLLKFARKQMKTNIDIEFLIYALQIFNQAVREYPESIDGLSMTGIGLLRYSSAALYIAYNNRAKYDAGKLRLIRSLTRDCFNNILSAKSDSGKISITKFTGAFSLFNNFSQYWYEDIDERLEIHRKIIDGTYPGTERYTRCINKFWHYVFSFSLDIPKDANWRDPGNIQENSRKWNAFVDSLVNSDKDVENIAGMIIVSKKDPEKDISAEVEGYLWKHRENIAYEKSIPTPYTVLMHLLRDPVIKTDFLYKLINYYIGEYSAEPGKKLNWHFFDPVVYNVSYNGALQRLDPSIAPKIKENMEGIYDSLSRFREAYPEIFNSERDLPIFQTDMKRSISACSSDIELKPDYSWNLNELIGRGKSVYAPDNPYLILKNGVNLWLITTGDKEHGVYYSVAEVSVPNGNIEKYDIPSSIKGTPVTPKKDTGFNKHFYEIRGTDSNYFFIPTSDNRIISYNKKSASWNLIELRCKVDINSLCYNNGVLYVAYADGNYPPENKTLDSTGAGIIAYELSTGEENLIVSTRRKEPENILDSMIGIESPYLFSIDSILFIGFAVRDGLSGQASSEGFFKACLYSYNPATKKFSLVVKRGLAKDAGLTQDLKYLISASASEISISSFSDDGLKTKLFNIKNAGWGVRYPTFDGERLYLMEYPNATTSSKSSVILNVIDKNGKSSRLLFKFDKLRNKDFMGYLLGEANGYLIFLSANRDLIGFVSKEKVLNAIKK
jgi:hypothetical protein